MRPAAAYRPRLGSAGHGCARLGSARHGNGSGVGMGDGKEGMGMAWRWALGRKGTRVTQA